jgi:hypothetical protein
MPFAVPVLPDVLVAVEPRVSALAVSLAIPELPDVIGPTGVGNGSRAVTPLRGMTSAASRQFSLSRASRQGDRRITIKGNQATTELYRDQSNEEMIQFHKNYSTNQRVLLLA